MIKVAIWMRESFSDSDRYIGLLYCPGGDQFEKFEIPLQIMNAETNRSLGLRPMEEVVDLIGFDVTI